MRRQTAALWAGRALRLDPGTLPVRYQLADRQGGSGNQVFLDRQRVVLRRTVAERMAMTVSLSVSAYEGVALRLFPADGGEGFAAAVMLVHRDEALSLPLHVVPEVDEAAEVWEAWGSTLGLPLLAVDEAGAARPVRPCSGLGGASPAPRRRHSHFAARRPRFLTRRKVGRKGEHTVIRGEREIIAPE